MSQQLGPFFKLLTDKIGIDPANEAYSNLLSLDTEISDEVFSTLKTGLDALMTEAAAKSNSELNRHFKAVTLAPIDKMLNEIVEASGFDDDFKTDFKTRGNTYDKLRKVYAKALELDNANQTSKTIDQAKLQEEINRFNNEIENVRMHAESERQRLKEESENAILNYALNAALEGKNYAAGHLPKKVNALTALTLLQEELTAKNARVVRSAVGTLKLICSDDPETDYTENNKPVSFGDFADALLAKHNMLKVSESPKAVNTIPQKPFVAIPGDQRNDAAFEANNENLAALEKAL